MKKYIGFKMIEAEPQAKNNSNENGIEFLEGYKVVYPDGYKSWSPKDVFEKAYMKIGSNNTITQEIVDSFIKSYEDQKLGDKTTIVKATLVNGFEIVESSSCVDPANFNQEIGKEICLNRIKDKIWFLLGFLLQTAKEGIR